MSAWFQLARRPKANKRNCSKASRRSRKGQLRSEQKRRVLRAELLEDRRLLATITWDGNSDGDGNNVFWNDAANWDLNRLPLATDDVVIPGSLSNKTNPSVNFLGINGNVIEQVRVLNLTVGDGATLKLIDDELRIEGVGTIDGALEVGGAKANAIVGDGKLNVNKTLDWRARGRLEIDTIVAAQATVQIYVESTSASIAPIQRGKSLANYGTMEVIGEGVFYQDGNTVLDNFGTFILPSGGRLFVRFQGGGGDFNNQVGGKLVKTGPGYSDFFNNQGIGGFNNAGIVEIQDGHLAIIRDQSSSGSFVISPTGLLSLQGGTHDFGSTSSIVGSTAGDRRSAVLFLGQVQTFGVAANPAQVNFRGTYDVPFTKISTLGELHVQAGAAMSLRGVSLTMEPSLNFAGSILDSAIDLEITGDFQWDAGTLGGIGQSFINLAGTSTFTGDVHDRKVLRGNLRNTGELTWNGDGRLKVEGAAQFENASGATFEILSGFNNNGSMSFTNKGLLHVISGLPLINTLFGRRFINEGDIQVEAGSALSVNSDRTTTPLLMNGGNSRIDGTLRMFGGSSIEINGGVIGGSGILYANNVIQNGGVINPGSAIGTLRIQGQFQPKAGATLNVDVGASGVDALNIIGNAQLGGVLQINTLSDFTPIVGNSYPILTADAVTGTFASVTGLSLGSTANWVVDYTATGVSLRVSQPTEDQTSEQIRQQFNAGVLRTRASLPAWLDAGQIGLPGESQKLGALFAPQIESATNALLPTADNPVTTLADLRSQLEAIGYSVDCMLGDANCTETLKVSLAEDSRHMLRSRQTAANTFAALSNIPAGVELIGTLEWDAELSLADVSLGLDAQGFYIDSNSQFDLSVVGGGDLSDHDFAIDASGLMIDFDGALSVPVTKPVSATLKLGTRLPENQFGGDPNSLFNVESAGGVTLNIVHTLSPGGLSYVGNFFLLPDCSGTQCVLQEISAEVDYPSSDDWLSTGIGLIGGIIDVILGGEAASNFNQLTLPLIGGASPSDTAPGLFGTNTATFDEPESSWMDKLFGAAKAIFNTFDSDETGNTIPSEGQGQFHTEGDRLIGSDVVRFDREVDGSGIRVGVISTGANGLTYAQVSGDVPANLPTFVDEFSYGGRGTAMLEVIHDIAPGAELSFASATDAQSLLAAITWLTDLQQVDIIVSDVTDYTAAMFGYDPTLAMIESKLRQRDVLYVQAAGNDGQRSYRDELEMVSVTSGNQTRVLHRFGGSPESPQTTQPVTIEPNSVVRVVLQTSQPYRSPTARIVGGVANLPDSIQLDRTGFSLASDSGRLSDVPESVDSFTLSNPTDQAVTVGILVELLAGELPSGSPTEFQLVVLGEGAIAEPRGTSLFGAATLDGVLVVGAAEITQLQQAAEYSSTGSGDGRKPDIVGPAGVETSGFGMRFLGEFHGSSSGAAHSAASAALLWELANQATATQIRETLRNTAKPLGSGASDLQSGHGLIDIMAAAQQLVPKAGLPPVPPAAEEQGLLDYFNGLSDFVNIAVPTDLQIEQLLSGAQGIFTDLMQMQVTFDTDRLGDFEADFPFDFGGIGSFDTFNIAGHVGLRAEPKITLSLGWDAQGPYLDVAESEVSATLRGIGEAVGTVFETFGLGAGATLTAEPRLNLAAIDRAGDGRIRLDDAQALNTDYANGDFSRIVPRLGNLNAEIYGDVILSFLDYVDVDPELPNRPHGGDPFIVRGRAYLEVDLSGQTPAWTFSELRIANPDIDGDEQPDYTLGILAENAILFGETLINSIEVPDFVKSLLGEAGVSREPRRQEAITRPRGMLPPELIVTGEATEARIAINAGFAQVLAAAGNNGEQVDQAVLLSMIRQELVKWMEGSPSDPGLTSASGEAPPGSLPIMQRLQILFNDITRAQVDDLSTPQDEFEISLNAAISSYLEWRAALEIVGLEPSDVVSEAKLQTLNQRIEGALRYAIGRANVQAIELRLAGAPLNHQYADEVVNGVRPVLQRGVIDRALDAVRWSQTAEFMQVASESNGLSLAQTLEDLVVRVEVNRHELVFPNPAQSDGTIGPEEGVLLEVDAGWQIKLPPAGTAPDLANLSNYIFSPSISNAEGNIRIQVAGAGNNNSIAGQKTATDIDFLTGLPLPSDLLPITIGTTDSTGVYRTLVKLGPGDTRAQVQLSVGLQGVEMSNTLTNVIQGRPDIQLFAAHGSEDDTALRQDGLFVEPGGLIALQARIRRGNGPLTDASLNFFVTGGGSLDQVEVSTTRHIPRTAKDGTATVFYTAPITTLELATVGVVYIENGKLFSDSIAIGTVTDAELLGNTLNPIAGQPGSMEATEFRDIYEQAQASGSSDGLQQFMRTWFDAVVAQTDTALAASTNLTFSNVQSVESVIGRAAAFFMDWLGHATQADVIDEYDLSGVLTGLISAIENAATFWLGRFDGSYENEGLIPLYRALAWGTSIETLLSLEMSLDTPTRLTRAAILTRSGVEVEFLPADLAQTSTEPFFTGHTDSATLNAKARVIIRGTDGTVAPVMQSDTLPAPVEVRLLPLGLADVAVDSAFTNHLFNSNPEIELQKATLGSRFESRGTSAQAELVAAPTTLTATVTRGPGETEIGVNIGVGIPGYLLTTKIVTYRDAPQLSLRGALPSEDDTSLRQSLALLAGQEAVLQVSLRRNDLPINEDVQLYLIGRGSLSRFSGDTGQLGVLGGIQYTPPVTPIDLADTHGVSRIVVRYEQDGVVFTDAITIRYEFDAVGDDGILLGTPDFIRANNRLERVLIDTTSQNSASELPQTDSSELAAQSVDILSDWWNGSVPGEGGVLYWLEQVQSPANGGAHAPDLDWISPEAIHDRPYREALNAALDNWNRWYAVADQLNLPTDIVGAVAQQRARDLLSDALQYAIQRVQGRCQARATETISAYQAGQSNSAQLEELLARLIIEGEAAEQYYRILDSLNEYEGFAKITHSEFQASLEQLCYKVVILDDESYLAGTPQRAQVRVKTGLTVTGLEVNGEPILLQTPSSIPLTVYIEPLGSAKLNGIGVGPTDANGIYDRVQATIGESDAVLAVNASVVFNFNHTFGNSDRTRVRGFTYTTKRLELDTTLQVKTTWALESNGPGKLSNQPITAVNGERVLIETRVTKGHQPQVGKVIYISQLGDGDIAEGFAVTDSNGRLRLFFTPPSDQVGRTQIAFAYQADGETIVDTLSIDYTTSEVGTEIDIPISEAQSIASVTAGRHLTIVGQQQLLGHAVEVDRDQLIQAQRDWLQTGLNADGTINSGQPLGLLARIQAASEAPLDVGRRLAEAAAREYLRWDFFNATFGIQDAFDSTARDGLVGLLQASLDSYVVDALQQQSAPLAQAAMRFASELEVAGLIQSVPEPQQYTVVGLIDRLGYEVRIDEAYLHGEADNAWVQAVVRVYMKDPQNPTGDKLRSAIATPIEVEAVPLGFRLVNARKIVKNNLYAAKAYIVDGDAALELGIHANDAFTESPLITIRRAGSFRLEAGFHAENATGNETDELPSMKKTIQVQPGQSVILDMRVFQGLSSIPTDYPNGTFVLTGPGSDAHTIEKINERQFRITAGDQIGIAQGIVSVPLATFVEGETKTTVKQIALEFIVSNDAVPLGENGADAARAGRAGLLNNSNTIAAFNDLQIPLAAESSDAQLGNAFGLSSIQLPFSGPLPSSGGIGNDLREWFSQSFDLLHIIDMSRIIEMLNGGLPVQPEELIRIKFDLDNAFSSLPPTLLAADLSGLLPDGFSGSVQLDTPQIGGQIVFGIDTSSSPFYVLTQPDGLRSNTSSVRAFFDGFTEEGPVDVGSQATQMFATFGVGATFNSTQDLIDGVLKVPRAEGFLSSRVLIDFSQVAAQTGKLRFHELSELANLRVDFEGNPIDTFQAIVEAEVTLPDMGGTDGQNNPLATMEVVGAIYSSPVSNSSAAGLSNTGSTKLNFQLRTGDLFTLPEEIRMRLATHTVDQPATDATERDDLYEPNDRWQEVTPDHVANLGALMDRLTLGGQDPAVSSDQLALTDAVDWFRFETTAVGNASSFVQIDFDRTRGDLDLGLYRLEGTELVHVRTDGLAFSDSARITLLGQPAGKYFVKVFDDRGGTNPFYTLTIDPPGRLNPGITATIGDLTVRDTSLELTVDSNLEFTGFLRGRVVMTFGEQDDIPVELTFQASIDTVADDPDDNGGFHAEISTALGGGSINVLRLRNSSGDEIPPPTQSMMSTEVSVATGGYLLFDYVSADNFKFAGLNAATGLWVMGQFSPEAGWHVPDTFASRAVAQLGSATEASFNLVLNGRDVELWAKTSANQWRRVLSQQFSDNLDGLLGVGTPQGTASYSVVRLEAELTTPAKIDNPQRLPVFGRTLFVDGFDESARVEWRPERGIWRIDETGNYSAKSLAIELGDWLLVDNALIRGTLDVQFNDDNILTPVPIVGAIPTGPVSSSGYVFAELSLEQVDALLFRVGPNESGTNLYPERVDSPRGLIAINDGFLTITPSGVRLGAGRASAGLQDVLFVSIQDAEIDLTTSNSPLFSAGSISISVPALSSSKEFVTITSSAPIGEPLFGLSKPSVNDPIPEFLFFQDDVLINFNTELIQQKIDVGGVFPFQLKSVGLRFNDAGGATGQIGNLADFDLLVTGEIDFESSIFDGIPFNPIFAVGRPPITNHPGVERRVSNGSAYVDSCDTTAITSAFPGVEPLCKNGFISTELHLGALLGDQPETLVRNLGPIYVGFAKAQLLDDPLLEFQGLVKLGGFQDGRFVPEITGSLAVTGEAGPLGNISVAGEFVPPVQIAGHSTLSVADDVFESKLLIDWYGQVASAVGSEFDSQPNQSALNLHTEFTNTFTDREPFNLSFNIQPTLIDTGDVCIDFNTYVKVCGSAVLNPDATDGEPLFAIREGSLRFGNQLGPLANLSVSAGGFGVGADGTIYVLPAGYTLEGAVFERGAFVDLDSAAPGGLFGFPDWVPIVISQLGLEFNGTQDGSQPLSIGGLRNAPGALATIANPSNFSVVVSGGLQGNELFPITGVFEGIKVDLGKLSSCVAVALSNNNVNLELFPGQIFAAACEFPIVGLNGITIGIEPVDLPGGVSVGGTLGLGIFEFDRPVDPDNPALGTEPQSVFYGIIEGEIVAADIGIGIELIVTQYGPVLARLKAAVPIPIGTLVGAMGGPIGAAFGTGSGFLIAGLEGGIVFGGDPLPVVVEPTDIFDIPQVRNPLRVTTADVRNAVQQLAFQNPTFAELLSFVTDPQNALDAAANYQQVIADVLTGRMPGLPVKFTWDDGYRLAVSGTLTNQYVAAQLGLGVTLGLNIGYDFDQLVHTNGRPVTDDNSHALDAQGNPLMDAASGLIRTVDEVFGFQLYGFADVEVFGLKLVGAGIFLDFSRPLNPVFNIAAALPSAPGLLSILLPAQGEIGLQLNFDGYVEGSVLASLEFLESVRNSSSGFLRDLLESVASADTGESMLPLERLANQLEADRRHAGGIDLRDRLSSNYDRTYDPAISGYDPARLAELPDELSALRTLWRDLLDLDGNGILEPAEVAAVPVINRQFVIDRILGNATVGISSILPDPFSLDPFSLDPGDVNLFSWARISGDFIQEMVLLASILLTDEQAAASLAAEIADVPFWAAIEDQMRKLHAANVALVDDVLDRDRLDSLFALSLNTARVSAVVANRIAQLALDAANAAAQKFAEVANPSVRLTGQLSPMLFGFPMGPPSQAIELTLNKHELSFDGTFSSLALLLNMNGLPAFVKDSTEVNVRFPFENLLLDMMRGQLPAIDPLAGPWEIGLESTFSVLGLEIEKATGLIFPAGAAELLAERIQTYNPLDNSGTTTLEPNKILVHIDHYQRLLDQGGILLDGRMTLPRFITDPFAFIAEIQLRPEYAPLIASLAEQCDVSDLFGCLASHPAEFMQLLAGLPEIAGAAATLEEVAQVQLFIPNFVDDLIETFDPADLDELQQLLDPSLATSSKALVDFFTRKISEATDVSLDILSQAYLIGSYGTLPNPFDSPLEPIVPHPMDPSLALPFPTTSKILGIPLGSGRLEGQLTGREFDLDLFGTFLGLTDIRFELNVDASNSTQLPLTRAGAEFVIGSVPANAMISPTAFQGSQEADEVQRQLISLLAHLGFTNDPNRLGGDIQSAVDSAFQWIDLNQLSSSAGAYLKAFSPGFDLNSTDPLRRKGGIEAYASLAIGNLLEGDFYFQVTPSSNIVPNVKARGAAKQILLPGLQGLSDSSANAILGSELEMIFNMEEGALDASLEGTITLFGQSFTLSGDTSLEIYDTGFVGEITLAQNASITAGVVSMSGSLTLKFDTRPESAFAAIIVGTDRNGAIRFPGFSLNDATFAMQIDADGLHIQEVSGKSNLFGLQLDFDGGFDVLPVAPYLANVNLMTSVALSTQIGLPNSLAEGSATVIVDQSGVSGTFDGSVTLVGVEYLEARGRFDSQGCLTIQSPISAHFQLPGPGAFCGDAYQVTAAISIADNVSVMEGDPQDATTTISFEVSVVVFGDIDPDFQITVPWSVSPVVGSNVQDDLILPSERKISFSASDFQNGQAAKSITFSVVRDTFYEERETFLIRLDASATTAVPAGTEFVMGRAESSLTILNDDEPQLLANFDPPSDTLVYFDFDREAAFGAPSFTSNSSFDIVPTPMLLQNFSSSQVVGVSNTGLRASTGLPTVFTEEDGNIVLGDSRALRARVATATIPGVNSNRKAMFEFTVDPQQGYWAPEGIEFFVQGSDQQGPAQNWELRWSLDNFATPLMSSVDSTSNTFEATELPGWTKHAALSRDGSLLCASGAITFRLINTSQAPYDWTIDNLALTGEHSVASCLSRTPNEIAAELAEALDQFDHRVPGGFELIGPGDVTVRLVRDRGDTDPDPFDRVNIEITGASPTRTILRFTDNGDRPTAAALVPITVHSNRGVRAVDFSGATLFNGSIDIDGPIAGGVQIGSLVAGSSIVVDNESGVAVDIAASGHWGADVQVSVTGDIGVLDVRQGWAGGLLAADSMANATFHGDFAAEVALQGELGCFEVIGGDLNSSSFVTGLASGLGNGSVDCIGATSAGGNGGSISGNFTIDGDVSSITSDGGTFDALLSAQHVDQIVVTYNSIAGTGGDIAGNIVVGSFDSITTYGGEITSSVTTTNPSLPSGRIQAFARGQHGGGIRSPNSFHFAGDVEAIIAQDIDLRIESTAAIGLLQLLEPSAGNTGAIVGSFTASRFGTISAIHATTADFSLTTIGEAFQLDGRSAWELIDAVQGEWLKKITLPAGVRPGQLLIDGQAFDFESNDGLLLGENRRLELVRTGFQTKFYVVPAAWQNLQSPFDVNDDGIISPLDVLLIINMLNGEGSGRLSRPSTLTRRPAPFVDTNGDEFVSPIDVLLVINYLNSQTDLGEGEVQLRAPVDDQRWPSSFATGQTRETQLNGAFEANQNLETRKSSTVNYRNVVREQLQRRFVDKRIGETSLPPEHRTATLEVLPQRPLERSLVSLRSSREQVTDIALLEWLDELF